MIDYLLRYCIGDAVRTAELPNLAAGEGILEPQAARWICMGVIVDLLATGRMTAGYYSPEGVLESVSSNLDQVLEACLIEWGTELEDWPDPFGLWLMCTPHGRAEGQKMVREMGEWFDGPFETGDFPKIRDEPTPLRSSFAVLKDQWRSSSVPARAVSDVLAARLDVPRKWESHLLVGFTIDWPLRERGSLRLIAPVAATLQSASLGGRALALGREVFGEGRVGDLSYRFETDAAAADSFA